MKIVSSFERKCSPMTIDVTFRNKSYSKTAIGCGCTSLNSAQTRLEFGICSGLRVPAPLRLPEKEFD
jgi:hypothetical protein